MPKLETPKLNKSKRSVADAVIGQMIASEEPSPMTSTISKADSKPDTKMEYSKDENGVTVGPKGNKIGRPKKKETKEQISFSISKDTKDKLMEYIAENDERSVSSVCATAIKEYLKNHS